MFNFAHMNKKPRFRETPIRFSQLSVLERVVDDFTNLGDDYVLTKFTNSNAKFEEPVARRFDGMTMGLAVKGTLNMIINLEEITVRPNSLVFIPPDMVFKPMGWEGDEMEAYLLFLSNRFIHDINIDLNAINTSLFASNNLVLELTEEQVGLMLQYFNLFHLNTRQENSYNRYIARDLASACGYQIMAFAEDAAARKIEEQPRSRKVTYVQKFLRLVRDFHRQERAISFYAEKMFISPKYLSLIIKEATGKSAGEWIDSYVIREAKNQLRYSGKNVQQIAYELNFSNQSTFGKYFKNLTGMSPTAFQGTL